MDKTRTWVVACPQFIEGPFTQNAAYTRLLELEGVKPASDGEYRSCSGEHFMWEGSMPKTTIIGGRFSVTIPDGAWALSKAREQMEART